MSNELEYSKTYVDGLKAKHEAEIAELRAEVERLERALEQAIQMAGFEFSISARNLPMIVSSGITGMLNQDVPDLAEFLAKREEKGNG